MRPKYFTVILLSFVFILNFTSFVVAATKKENERNASINEVLKTSFQLQKSQMLSSLRKGIQKKDFTKGKAFKGEFPEFKNIAGDLRKVDFHVDEIPNGFKVTAKKGKHKLKAEIEFINFVEGIVKVNGVEAKIGKNATYPQIVQGIGRIVLLPFAKKKKKKVGFNLFNWNWPLSSAYAEEESDSYSEYVYKRPNKIPKAYVPLWKRIMGKDEETIKNVKTAGAVSALGSMTIGLGLTSASAAALGPAALLFIPGVGLLALGIIGATAFAADYFMSRKTHLDELEEAGNTLNSVLFACQKGKKDFYKKSPNGRLTLGGEHMAELEKLNKGIQHGNRMKRSRPRSSASRDRVKQYKAFQTLWSASRSLNGRIGQSSRTEVACKKLRNMEKFERFGLGKMKSTKTKKVMDDWVTPTIGSDAISRLCNVYTGVLKCFRSVPSPYGEREEEESRAAIYDGDVEEVNEAFEDYYKSMPSKVLQ